MEEMVDSTGNKLAGLKTGLRKLSWLSNKYLLAIVAFGVWMLFFDRNDFFSQIERANHSAALRKTEEKKLELITATQKELNLLKTNSQTIEKYARENYLMKKDNEDLFIFPSVDNTK